ncbi:MAG: EamA family transporter [Candidatus Woesearchaeota archaeon]
MNIVLILILMVVSCFIGALGSLFFKLSAPNVEFNISKLIKNKYLFIGLIFYGVSCMLFVWLLKFSELSFLYPLASLTYVFIALLSIKYLHEKMNILKWLGIVFIILGVTFITL